MRKAKMFDKADLENVNPAELEDNKEIMEFVNACAHRCYDLVRIYEEPTVTLHGLDFEAVLTVNQIKTKFSTLRTKLKQALDLVVG